MNYIKFGYSIFGLFASLVCLVLFMVSNVGTVNPSLLTGSLFLMELNMDGIAMELLFPDFNNGSYADYGFADTYYFGMYGYCGLYFEDGFSELDDTAYSVSAVIECASSSTYEFDMSTFIEDQVWYIPSTNAEFNLPGSLQQNTKRTMNLSKVVYIFSILAIVFCFMSMAAQLLYLFYGKGLVIVCCLKVFTFCFSLISSAAALGTYKYIADQINLYNCSANIQSATLSTGFMVVTWLATFVGLIAVVLNAAEKFVLSRDLSTEKP